MEGGILAKSKRDVPISKINDAEMNQGIIQRIFGAGNIFVLTGNDRPTIIKNIESPEEFKNQITDAIQARMKNSSLTA